MKNYNLKALYVIFFCAFAIIREILKNCMARAATQSALLFMKALYTLFRQIIAESYRYNIVRIIALYKIICSLDPAVNSVVTHLAGDKSYFLYTVVIVVYKLFTVKC